MTYRMFVDDVRDPQWVYADQDVSDWQVARSFEEAVMIMSDLGCPEWISLDHDLGDQTPTGYDLCKWMVEQDLHMQGAFMMDHFSYACHSANPVGVQNMQGLLDSYAKAKKAKS